MVLGRKDGRGVNNVDEAVIKRVPPHNDEAERSVIGAMLMDKDAIMTAAEMLNGDDFYQTAYGILFDAMVELFNEGQPVDLITLAGAAEREKCTAGDQRTWNMPEICYPRLLTSANVQSYRGNRTRTKRRFARLIKINGRDCKYLLSGEGTAWM